MKKLLFLILFPFTVFANDCTRYKKDPAVDLSIPKYEVSVEQPAEFAGRTHGTISATLSEAYEIEVETQNVPGGICVILTRVSAEIGHTEFEVKLDPRFVEGTCEYDAVLTHEMAHLREYLSVMDREKKNLRRAVTMSATDVFPVFIKSTRNIDEAIDSIRDSLQDNPRMRLAIRKIMTEQEIRNKKIDQDQSTKLMSKCK